MGGALRVFMHLAEKLPIISTNVCASTARRSAKQMGSMAGLLAEPLLMQLGVMGSMATLAQAQPTRTLRASTKTAS